MCIYTCIYIYIHIYTYIRIYIHIFIYAYMYIDADCLEAIASDPHAIICRVKNRLTMSYDDRKSAGYRDVLLNVSIVSEYTQQLGIDGYI